MDGLNAIHVHITSACANVLYMYSVYVDPCGPYPINM